MIKTKQGKTVIKGNILTDIEDLVGIMSAIKEKHNLLFLKATLKSIMEALEKEERNNKNNDLINKF